MARSPRSFELGLKAHLAVLTLVVLIPLGIVAAGALYLLWKSQEAQLWKSHRDLAQALAVAIDRQLEGTIHRAQLLAQHPDLREGRLEAFSTFARAAQRDRAGWANVVLLDRRGTQLFNALERNVEGLPNLGDREYVRDAFRTGEHVVSGLVMGRMSKQPIVVVAVPVVRGGEVQYLLLVSVNLSTLDAVLTQQLIPAGGVAAVIDRDYRIVARSSKAAQYVGQMPVPALVAELKKGAEGASQIPTLDGVPTYAAWVRIPASGWWLAVGLPLESTRQALTQYLGLLTTVFAAILAAAIVLSSMLAGRIARSIRAAADSAAAVARGDMPAMPVSRIRELNVLADALDAASARLADAEQSRTELLEAERRARATAETANRAKDEFLAMLGHELRNPLAPIVTALAVIKAKADGELSREQEIIARQVNHLRRLVDDLLDVSRLTRGKVQLNLEIMELNDAVVEALETTSPLLEQRRHRVHVNVPRTGLAIYGDRIRLAQVVANLLTNAAKYTPDGGDIYVSACRDGSDVSLSVKDTGIGIPSKLLPHVFEIFYQGRDTTERTEGGLGLGLAIVKNLIALHGGSVRASSAGEGRGSEFTVRLPLSERSAGDHVARISVVPARGRSPQCVLVVDDNHDAAELTAELLRLAGHAVVLETNPLEALENIERTRPTVAVLDISMPVIDGYELAQRIRERLGSAAPRMIAVTGYGAAADRDRAYAAGFDVHLAKPVDGDALVRAVEGIAAQKT